MVNFDNLPPELQLFLEHTVRPVKPSLKEKVITELKTFATSLEHLKAILNLLNGMNYKVFKKYVEQNPTKTNIEDFELSKTKVDFGLNPEQLEATIHNHERLGPLLIIAGAGSGKTAVLTRRIVYLVVCGTDPEDILSVTFTNKAAGEMKERILEIMKEIASMAEGEFLEFLKLQIEKVPDMWVSTFHSFCLRLLYEPCLEIENYKRAGYESQPKIISTLAQKSIFEKLYVTENINEISLDDMISMLDMAKNELFTEEYYRSQAKTPLEKKIANIYENYQLELKKRNEVDFNDIIMNTAKIFEDYPEILDYYIEKFKFILVDEYQDTNFAQYLLVYKLAVKYQRLFVVGDDDQSIYGWRGADIRNILNFKKDFPKAFIVKFERNYRSSQIILEAANAIFTNKPLELRKQLKVTKRNKAGSVLLGAKIKLKKVLNDVEEVKYCAKEIRRLVNMNSKDFEKQKKDFFIKSQPYFESFIQSFYEFLEYLQSNNDLSLYGKSEKIYLSIYTKYNALLKEIQNNLPLNNSSISDFVDSVNDLNDLLSSKLNEEYNNYIKELLKFVSSYLSNFRDKTFQYKDFAIFYRINSQKHIVKDILNAEKIPFIEIGDTRFFEHREVNNILSFFELLISVYKYLTGEKVNISVHINQKFLEIISLPFYELSPEDRTIVEHQTPNRAIIDEDQIEKMMNRLSVNGKLYFNHLCKSFENIFALDANASLVELFQLIVKALMYDKSIEEDYERKKPLTKNIIHFKEMIIE
jgi:superfamily I DNA/RNA helicase